MCLPSLGMKTASETLTELDLYAQPKGKNGHVMQIYVARLDDVTYRVAGGAISGEARGTGLMSVGRMWKVRRYADLSPGFTSLPRSHSICRRSGCNMMR
jgi:hypothetical protein